MCGWLRMEDPGHTIPITALTISLTKYTDVIIRGMWEELEQATGLSDRRFSYTSRTRYKELRSSFYSPKKSSCYAGYISCTCPEGIMDVVCKHSLMLMEVEKLIDPLPQPLDRRQKRGRKRKIGHALERV